MFYEHPDGRLAFFELAGRLVSQKNSNVIRKTRLGRLFVAHSALVCEWRSWAELQLSMQRNKLAIETLGSKDRRLQVSVVARFAVGQSIDADNVAGGILDALQGSHVIANDRFVDVLHVELIRDSERPGASIQICEQETIMPCGTKPKTKPKGKGKGKEK